MFDDLTDEEVEVLFDAARVVRNSSDLTAQYFSAGERSQLDGAIKKLRLKVRQINEE
jgi:hypothetical protein